MAARVALVALIVGSQTHIVYGRPFQATAGKARSVEAAQATPAAALSRNAQPDLMQDLVSAFVEEHSHKDRPRSEGYMGIHPLPRRRDVDVTVVKRQAALPNILPANNAAADPPPPTSAGGSSSASASAASSASPTSTASPSSAPASSSQPPSITPASKSASSSSKSASPTSSDKPDDDDDDDDANKDNGNSVSSFFSPHNKLFPLAIALTVAMGLGVLLVLVSIGKCVSHRKMAREIRDGSRQHKSKDSSVLTSELANSGAHGRAVGRTRTLGKSLRRALTRGKLGGNSFARRNREGTVLIDVGDEVLAVTPEVAREYERERKSALSSYRSSTGSSGSRLTFPANQPTPMRQALYNAQLIVAASQAEMTSGKPQAPRGFDINSWRADSALPSLSEDDEKTLNGDRMSNGSRDSFVKPAGYPGHDEAPLSRSLSQRLADGLRALTAGTNTNEQLGEPYTSRTFSFDSEKQVPGGFRQAQAPLSATVPVLTRGGGGWAIQRQTGTGDDEREIRPIRPMRPVKQASDSTLRDSALSHDRVALQDGGAVRRGPAAPAYTANATNAMRPKSILIKRSQDQLRQQQQARPVQQQQKQQQRQAAAGGYRSRAAGIANVQQTAGKPPRRANMASSTAPGSPKTLQGRNDNSAGATRTAGAISSTATGAGAAGFPSNRKPIVLKPEMPSRGMTANGGQASTEKKLSSDDGSSSSRELYRPLPMPPAFGPLSLESSNNK